MLKEVIFFIRSHLIGLKPKDLNWLKVFFLTPTHALSKKTVTLINKITTFLCAVLFLFGFYTVLQLKTEYSLKQFYPADHPLLLEENKISQLFKLDKNQTLALLLKTPDHSSWLRDEHFLVLEKITKAFQNSEQLETVISLATLDGAQNTGAELNIGPLFESKKYKEKKKIARHHPFVKPHLLSENEDATLLVIKMQPASPLEMHKYIESLNVYFKKNFSDYKLSIGGISALQADMSTLLKRELSRSIWIGLVLFICGLLMIYKNPSAVFSVLITLVFVNVVILGVLTFFGISLNVLLSTLPILISLAVISLVIHIQGHLNQSKNIWLTYKDLFTENLIAVTTTSIGFLFLKTSASQLIQNYGLIVALSSFLAWFLTHLIYWPLSFLIQDVQFRNWLEKPAQWSLWSLNYKKTVLTLTGFVFLLGFYSLFHINWNSRALDDLPEHQNTRKTTEYIDRHFGGTLEMNFVIRKENKKIDWAQASNIKKLDQALSRIKKLKNVGSVISVNDFYKSISSTQKLSRLPASNSDLAEKNFLFSISGKNPLDHLLSPTQEDLLIKVRYQDVMSNQVHHTTQLIKSVLHSSFPNTQITSSGFAEQFHTMNKEISKDLVFGFWQALLIAGLLLIFVFKSWRLALLACLPNMLPPLVLLTWLSYQQISLKPTIAIIFSIAIGLAFTNTVYIIGRILKIKKLSGLQHDLPVREALLQEGNPCLLATLLVVLGFFVFLFSYFSINRIFGEYMILSVVAALIGDLVFMPSFLEQFKKYFINASIALIAINLAWPANAANTASVVEILKKCQSQLISQDDSALVSMKIIDADGSTQERELNLKRKFSNKKHQTLVKILKPQNQKGAGFLSVVENQNEQQWIYLPSSKQARRFVSKNKQEGVLGSELSPQDLDLTTIQSARAQFVKLDKIGSTEVSLIEVKANKNQTNYSKAILWIDTKRFLPLRIEYYDTKLQPFKRIDFENYAVYNKIQRAQKVIIKNLKNRRGTELLLSQIKVNSGLSDLVFTQRALSKD